MENFTNYPILVAFFLAITIAAISATNEESLDQCARHVGSYCGKQVYDKLFNDKPLTLECCYKVVQMGHSCDTKMVKNFLQTKPELKGENWTHVLAKSDKIFYKCDQVTKPAEPQLLGMCREKIGPHCENEVFEKLVHQDNNTVVTKRCCEKLGGIGEYCNVNLVKDFLRTSFEIRSANATDVLKRSKEIYHNCQNGSAEMQP